MCGCFFAPCEDFRAGHVPTVVPEHRPEVAQDHRSVFSGEDVERFGSAETDTAGDFHGTALDSARRAQPPATEQLGDDAVILTGLFSSVPSVCFVPS